MKTAPSSSANLYALKLSAISWNKILPVKKHAQALTLIPRFLAPLTRSAPRLNRSSGKQNILDLLPRSKLEAAYLRRNIPPSLAKNKAFFSDASRSDESFP